MITQQITATRQMAARSGAVWALVEDVQAWSTWGPFETAERERDGSIARGGVGAIHRFRRGRWTTREEVTVFDAGRRVGYRLLSGLPVRDYDAAVTLTQRGAQTVVTWEAAFRPLIPGTGRAIRGRIAAFASEALENLAVAVELLAKTTTPSVTRELADAAV